MRIFVLLLTFCGLNYIAQSQNVQAEKSVYGIQAGLLGVWAHREIRMSNSIALRAEVGMDAGIWGGTFYPETGYLITPVFTVEPRWYYNLNKRNSKSKNIAGNSGNFLTLQASFHPNGFVISNYHGVEIVNQVSFIPTWGIRRVYGKHFIYELGFGVGYRYLFAKSAGYSENESETAVNLHLKIGYCF